MFSKLKMWMGVAIAIVLGGGMVAQGVVMQRNLSSPWRKPSLKPERLAAQDQR